MIRSFGSVGSAVATMSVVFLMVGLVWPGFAATLLQALIGLLALAFVGTRVYRARLPAKLANDVYSPFDRMPPPTEPPSEPAAVRHLSSMLEPVEGGEAAKRVPIPVVAHRILVAEVSRRLAEHHGLDLSDPAEHPRIQDLVSDPTWALIRSELASGRTLALRDPVPVLSLSAILDDVERL